MAPEPAFTFAQGKAVNHYLEISIILGAHENGFDLNRFHMSFFMLRACRQLSSETAQNGP